MSFPALFFALAVTALIAALVAVWNSLREALGGGRGVVLATASDLPDHAALVEEKNSLLRAIKDLEYERAVGKISDADHQRLDAAYRLRAKQVLEQLDRDVKPLYAEAEKLIAARISAGGETRRAKPKKAAESEAKVDELVESIRAGKVVGMPELPADLSPEQREKVTQFLVQAIEKTVRKPDADEDVKADAADADVKADAGAERAE